MTEFKSSTIQAPSLLLPTRKVKHSNFILRDSFCRMIGEVERSRSSEQAVPDDIPDKIIGSYNKNYNILYLDDLIVKKIQQERFGVLERLRAEACALEQRVRQTQTYLERERCVRSYEAIQQQIADILGGRKLLHYQERVNDLLSAYRQCQESIKTVSFHEDDIDFVLTEQDRERLSIIERYLEIAGEYLSIEIVRVHHNVTDFCLGCGALLDKLSVTDTGTLLCPEENCRTEHNTIITCKLTKDLPRASTSCFEDESIENFIRAFIRYQGLQSEHPDEKLYIKLDHFFILHDRPTGEQIKQLPLNSRGRRGDTSHKMLWDALSKIGCSKYYEDANLIGYIYWGWTLPNVMHHREKIMMHYIKTQRVFYQIPVEERERTSSLGTQYRLWRHLQLVGHECDREEFKIAENSDSFRTHNKLWKMMCEGANDPEIYCLD